MNVVEQERCNFFFQNEKKIVIKKLVILKVKFERLNPGMSKLRK